MLAREAVGVLATASGEQPFLNGNLFVHDPAARAIYVHTARRGRTRSNAEANPRGCFHVFRLGRLLPADTALEFSAEEELDRTTVLRLAVEAWSGKRNAAPPDFPGAYPRPEPAPPVG